MERTGTTNLPAPGVLLVGHGTRNRAGQAEFLALAEMVAQRRPDWRVEPGFLEICEPGIDAAVARLAESGRGPIVAIPLMLLAAGHVQSDVPQAVAAAAGRHAIDWRLSAHLGSHAGIAELSRRRREACYDTGLLTAGGQGGQHVVLVARGSSDAGALAEMEQFAAGCRAAEPDMTFSVGYCAVARPSLEEALRAAGATSARRVIVQPHLLFQGDVLAQIGRAVDEFGAGERENREWRMARHLGVDPLIVGLLVELTEETLREMPNLIR